MDQRNHARQRRRLYGGDITATISSRRRWATAILRRVPCPMEYRREITSARRMSALFVDCCPICRAHRNAFGFDGSSDARSDGPSGTNTCAAVVVCHRRLACARASETSADVELTARHRILHGPSSRTLSTAAAISSGDPIPKTFFQRPVLSFPTMKILE